MRLFIDWHFDTGIPHPKAIDYFHQNSVKSDSYCWTKFVSPKGHGLRFKKFLRQVNAELRQHTGISSFPCPSQQFRRVPFRAAEGHFF